MAKNDAPENPLALDPEVQKEKREANEDRLNERREQGLVRSFDRTDSNIGWDAQQGALPAQDPEGIYADDPVKFAPEQLPNPEVLREAGLDPVISRTQVADDDDSDRVLAGHDGGPQTANVTESRELKEVDPDGDAPLTAEDAAAQKNAAEGEKKNEDSKSSSKKSSSKKSSKKS